MGTTLIEINLDADYDVVAKRFDERVADALAKQSKTISNTSKERFKELYEIYQSEKNPAAISFRSDIQTSEEIVQDVLKLL